MNQDEYQRAMAVQNMYNMHQAPFDAYAAQQLKSTEKKNPMFKEITSDVKGFVVEHRGVIYFVAIALLLDHFVFNGAFKERLKGMAEKIVGKVEEKITNG